ncbi:MAG: TetR/AcrR family transcriptional regulator [Novosphingobium sp.]|nr:TetR/AcrR family transcriptional regulator [Novosphingobium sp.]
MVAAHAPDCRRREARRRDRREAILEVARASFLENGYDGTTMSGIAAAVGGSKATLWNYFPSKDVLFAAVLDHATDQFRKDLSAIFNPDDSVETTLRRFCKQYIGKLTQPDTIALYRLVVGEAGRFPEVGRIFYERAAGRTRETIARYFEGAVERGRMPACDCRIAANQLFSLCISGSHQMLLMGMKDRASGEEIDSDVENAVATFRRAYLPMSPTSS